MLSAFCRRFAVTVAALISSGCTFYTACPTGNTNNPNPTGNNGGMGNSGGSGAGGSMTGVGGEVPSGKWVSATSNLTELDSECGNLSFIAAKPNEDRLITSVALRGLWESTDGGDSWVALGQGAGSDDIANRGSWMVFDPADSKAFWEVGKYNGAGVFKTEDDGATFKQVGKIESNDFLSVDFSDPDRLTLLASGHEVPHALFRSVDGGANFESIGDLIPDEQKVCPYPTLIDTDTYLLGCGTYAGGDEGILRSTDAGETWSLVNAGHGGVAPLFASDGTIYWMGEGNAGMVLSTDQGETWSESRGKNLVGNLPAVEMPDGSIAAVTGGNVVITKDQGETWTLASPQFPFAPTGMLYSEARKAFFIWHFTCSVGPVPEDAIMRFDFDYEN